MTAFLRPYRVEDLDAVYDVCVRTAAAGADARGVYRSDRLPGEVWAAPYLVAEPDLASVVDDGHGGLLGYVLGTADTARFVDWYRQVWIPATARRCPPPSDTATTPDDAVLAAHHRPERMLVPEVAAWPAHLHVDLLPAAQGQGWGRRLLGAFFTSLRDAGVDGVHLSMDRANTGARAFYDRLGFRPVQVAAGGVWLVRDTSPPG